MDETVFNEMIDRRHCQCMELMKPKGAEYRRGGDVLHNFKRAAPFLGALTPAHAVICFLAKHLVSVWDIVDDCARGIYPTEKIIDEKFSDIHNYFYLMEAAIREKMEIEATMRGKMGRPTLPVTAGSDSP